MTVNRYEATVKPSTLYAMITYAAPGIAAIAANELLAGDARLIALALWLAAGAVAGLLARVRQRSSLSLPPGRAVVYSERARRGLALHCTHLGK